MAVVVKNVVGSVVERGDSSSAGGMIDKVDIASEPGGDLPPAGFHDMDQFGRRNDLSVFHPIQKGFTVGRFCPGKVPGPPVAVTVSSGVS